MLERIITPERVAEMPSGLQAQYDKIVTRRRLPKRRDLLLATNGNPDVPPGAKRRPMLDYVSDEAGEMLEGKKVLIVAFAGRNFPYTGPHHPETANDYETATEKAVEAVKLHDPDGFVILHREEDQARAVANAGAFYVTGGSTPGHAANLFGLQNFDGKPVDNSRGASTRPLHRIFRAKVADGTSYVGISAGQMIATANTIPQTDPPALVQVTRNRYGEPQLSLPLTGLNLPGNFGLSIQSHFIPDKATNSGAGETQYGRAVQILEKLPWLTMLGMGNNSALRVNGRNMTLIGDPDASAHILTMDRESGVVVSRKIKRGADLSYLLDTDDTLPLQKRLER